MDVVAPPKRGEVCWVALDPAMGSEMQKTRPGLVVSPDELNRFLTTVIIAPITSTLREYPYRVACKLKNKRCSIAIDQLRAVDRSRLGKKVARVEMAAVLSVLAEMFAP